MKKFKFILIMLLIVSLFNTAFATETEDDTMYLYTNESGELIESNESPYEDDNTVIEEPEDYDDIYGNTSNQEELKSAFEEQKTEFLAINKSEEDNVKLIVTEVLSDIKSEYTTDYYYYYMIKYQLVKLRTEDGSETSAVVILSYDISDDKNIKPLKAGDTIYGYIETVSSDSDEYNRVQHGLTDESIALVSITEQDRSLGVILLAILAILLLILYAGKHGAKLLIPIFVAIDLLFIVLVPELQVGANVLILSILISLELIILITVLRNGFSRKTVVSIISSIIVIVLISTLGLFFASTNRISGKGLISEENYDLQSNVYYMDQLFKSEIDTQMLYLSMIMIIVSVVTATISSRLADLSEKYAGSKEITNNIIEEAKSMIADYPMIITIIFLVMSLPKYMAILYNYTPLTQILNSEILITDLSILSLTLISAIIISPIHAIISNLLMGNVEIKQIDNKSEK